MQLSRTTFFVAESAAVQNVPVLGVGVVTPFGAGIDPLFQGLCRAEPVFRHYPPFADAGVKTPVAAAVADELLCELPGETGTDRGTKLLFTAVRDALLDATGEPSLAGFDVPLARIALVAGTSASGISALRQALRTGAPSLPDTARYSWSTYAVARAFGFGGPVMIVGGVCASGALAIAEAAQLIRDGDADVAVAAGYDPLDPFVGAGFDALAALTDTPKPFCCNRKGLVLGEGAAALVLGRAPRPRRQPRGLVCGWGSSTDAHHLTSPHPEGVGVVLAIERALWSAGVDRQSIGSINMHGTGTPYNDVMESRAVGHVFGPRAGGLPCYTVKGTIGHTLAAAGAIEATVALAAMKARLVPPSCAPGEPDPECDVDLVVREPRPCKARRTLSISAGFGGINCVLVLGAYEDGDQTVSRSGQTASVRQGEQLPVVVRRAAVWVAGRWIEHVADVIDPEQPGITPACETAEAPLDLLWLSDNRRFQRADRATQLGAMVMARALAGLDQSDSQERVSMTMASALASVRSNVEFEQKRIETGRGDPRLFAFTATTAAVGEAAAAIGARGPTVVLIGGSEVGLVALHRACRWIAEGECQRAIVLSVECPPLGPSVSAPSGVRPVECAVALVLDPACDDKHPRIRTRWREAEAAQPLVLPSLLSVGPLAQVALACTDRCDAKIVARAERGAAIEVVVAPRSV